MAASSITRTSTMQDVLEAYPGAQRALSGRYHIGGCSSCGFQPGETLEQVLGRHNVLDVDEVLLHLQKADEAEKNLQIKPREVAELLAEGKIKLIDVRNEFEWQTSRIEGALLINQELIQEIVETWAKDTALVLHCHHGIRSLDAAAFFIGHGFTSVRSMEGGIDAWSHVVDSSVPRYSA